MPVITRNAKSLKLTTFINNFYLFKTHVWTLGLIIPTIPTFILLYKNMVRSYLDYCSSVWSPYSKCDIEDLQKVQKRATRLLPELKGRNYIDRLKVCKLPTLHFRCIRGDMIETYKIVSGKYDNLAAPMLPSPHSYVTRGHDSRLQKNRARYDLRKKFFH